ncbi:Head-specific guanylate cyclase [Eumeta japonica]|uniref:Head-specific guanylate cyclase n=1 Tax=Eumeta variegata TaxID=151549 RepID=A0A4C1TGL3_EUMVA|nr:Head-specific guanylate cyclase [Eumeta japonica]
MANKSKCVLVCTPAQCWRGVVGRKMPRYCLFGHNVTIANKFESGGEACKIMSALQRETTRPSVCPKNFLMLAMEPAILEKYRHPYG